MVLTLDEIARLIAGAGNLQYQAGSSGAYGAGLRASEVVNLKVGDIDSQRVALPGEQGKGQSREF